MNVIKTRGKRVRDDTLRSWSNTWLPISQYELSNDNTVTFTDPLMTIHINELYVCVNRMSLMQFTGHSPPSTTSSSFKLTNHEIKETIRYFIACNPRGYTAPNQ